MGSRMVNIPAIFAQHFDDIIHTPSLIKRSTFTTPKSSHWQCSRNHRCQGWVQIKPVSSRSELFFGVRIKKVIVISNTPRFQTEAWMILKRKSFNKNHRDQVLWFRETENPTQTLVFSLKPLDASTWLRSLLSSSWKQIIVRLYVDCKIIRCTVLRSTVRRSPNMAPNFCALYRPRAPAT